MMLWTWERGDEDDYADFYIKRNGKTAAYANSQEWAEFICHALNRDEALHQAEAAKHPPQEEVLF